jgi:hypothetical protein
VKKVSKLISYKLIKDSYLPRAHLLNDAVEALVDELPDYDYIEITLRQEGTF